MPDIDLELTPAVISEDAGIDAVFATIRRSGVTNNKVTLRLTADKRDRLILPSTVVLEKGETESVVAIGVIDNDMADGEQTVNITAEVYISACDCGVVGSRQGSMTRQLRILDNDGPTLTLTSSQSTIREGDDEGTEITLTRNTDTSRMLIVRLQADDSEVMLPTQVTIPASQLSTTFRARARSNRQQEGSRVAVISAAADGFNSGAVWLYITDTTLPDMAVSGIAVQPATILAGDDYQLAVTIANVGVMDVPARSTYTVSVGEQTFTMTLPEAIAPSTSHTATLDMKAPSAAGDYTVTVEANKGRAFDEVQLTNNTRTMTLSVKPAYTYTVVTDRNSYQTGQTVRISGQVTALRGTAQGIAVEPYVICHGTRHALTATTDANGRFEADFTLQAGMNGNIAVGACAPGENSSQAMASFAVYGMARTQASYIKSYMFTGEPYTVRVPIKNMSSLPLHNIKATATDDVGHYVLTAKNISTLDGNAEDEVELTLRSDTPTTTDNWERVWITLSCDEATTLSFVLYAFTDDHGAELVADRAAIRANIVSSRTTTIPVVLTNRGAGKTGRISISMPKNQSFITLGTPAEMPSMAQGDSTVVNLVFNPAGLPVGVVQSGTLAVNCDNADGIVISYSLKVVGEEKGSLLVSVEDELTIYGNADGEHPLVAGATVQLKDYNTGKALYTETTTDAGTALFSDIDEGYYTLLVTAPKHSSYMQHVLVSPAETTEHVATISFEPVSITWNVEETEVEDRYEIVQEQTFETQVPVPVIKIDSPDEFNLYDVEQGHDLLYYITVENLGLITAQNVCVSLPSQEGFLFTPLAEYSGFDLAPKQSRTIPVLVTYAPNAESRSTAEGKKGPKCHDYTWCNWEWVCKADRTAWIGKLGKYLMRACDPDEPTPKAPKPDTDKVKRPVEDDDPIRREIDEDNIKMRYWKMEQPDLELLKEIVSFISCALTCALPHNIREIWVPNTKDIKECVKDEIKERLSRKRARGDGEPSLREQYLDKLVLYIKLNTNVCNYYAELSDAPTLMEDAETFNMLIPAMDGITDLVGTMHAQGTLYDTPAADIAQKALAMMPQNCGEWYDFSLTAFIERQVNTYRLRDDLAYSGSNACNIVTLDTCRANIADCQTAIEQMGFVDHTDMIRRMNDDAEALNSSSKSVCATVKMQITQDMVFTRQAFRGTLTIDNTTDEPITDIAVQVEATDENGNIATTHEMQIDTESAVGFTLQSDGSYRLEPGQAGTFTFLFIPTKYAAMYSDVVYDFGGSLAYNNGAGVLNRELYPVSLTVKPSPVLDLTYFMQRDLYGDDPLTEDVEPMVPAEFALIINNKGYDDATDVRMVTQQPVITENEKGLLIDFQIVSSQVNGSPAALSFGETIANDFGTIAAQSQAYAQWWLTSTLMGHFIDYNVSATHLTSYGNEDLSLLDQVSIHELVHGFTVAPAGQAATRRGFLVNDVPDADDLPDEVYLTDGQQQSVTKAAGANISSMGQNTYLLTITPTTSGWTYGSLPDPTGGRLQIASIVRRQDGTTLPADNAWLTPVTMRDGKDPVHESRLHFVCHTQGAAETWLLTFEERQEQVGIDDVTPDGSGSRESIFITPLPLGDQMFVRGNFKEIRQLAVYDMQGVKHLQATGLRPGQQVSTSSLAKGVYHVVVCTEKGIYTKKVLKR